MQKDARNVTVKDIQSCWSFLLKLSKSKLPLKNLIKSRKIGVVPKLLPIIMSLIKPTRRRVK